MKPDMTEEDAFMATLLAGFEAPKDARKSSNAAQIREKSNKNGAKFTSIPPSIPSLTSSRTASTASTSSYLATPADEEPFIHNSPAIATASNPSPNFDGNKDDVGDLLEGAELWDMDTWNDFSSPERPKPPPKKPTPRDVIPAITLKEEPRCRCVVRDVSLSYAEGTFTSTKRLTVKTEPEGEVRQVNLRDTWADADIRAGDFINVIGTFSSHNTPPSITITDTKNLLILHPDVLLTATAISSAPQCLRRPILSSLVRSTSDITPALVWGNVIHTVMQSCMVNRKWDDTSIDEAIDDALMGVLGDLLKIGINIDQAREEVKLRSRGLQKFAQRFISMEPKADAQITNTRDAKGGTAYLAITKLHDIEEDIWSPTYGIKGKVDVSMETLIEERNATAKRRSELTLPFEIKTGKSMTVMEHRAQTMLYTILMAQRYGVEVPSGLLYYTQHDEVIRVPAGRNEIRALIGARNDMASYLMRRTRFIERLSSSQQAPPESSQRLTQYSAGSQCSQTQVEVEIEPFLPPTIDDPRACSRCYNVDACMLYRRAVEDIRDEFSPISDLYSSKTGHLTAAQCEFFKKWEALLSFEEQESIRFRKELWTMGAQEREDRGRCMARMILEESRSPSRPKAPVKEMRIHQHTYRFARGASGDNQSKVGGGQMLVGDPVTISVEPDLIAFARGYILELGSGTALVGLDHAIDMERIKARLRRRDPEIKPTQILFRIDKDEMTSGLGRVRDNLAQLFYASGDARRRAQIVDLEAPTFDQERAEHVMGRRRERLRLAGSTSPLNANQEQALEKALAADDYALILGMPGTGKTTTIAELIRVLAAEGKTVLLTSYTHSAVDTILLKLKGTAGFDILRLGNIDKVHPEVHSYTMSARKPPQTVEELEEMLLSPPVVATTCLSIDHALFHKRRFDYCIVDEASQVTLPTCVGPLRFADRFILVGDHFQLPPLVKNPHARRAGLEVSLFRRLSDAQPDAVVDLAWQYRMNEDIMLVANTLVYSGRLRCGNEQIAKAGLRVPGWPVWANKTTWVGKLMQEGCKATFVDTSALPAHDTRSSSSGSSTSTLIQNPSEAALITHFAGMLIRYGVRSSQICVITVYRAQVALLLETLRKANCEGVEVLTADRSQGRDKDCVLLSLVRSNEEGEVGDLFEDWRRLNVAFTRAKRKLVVFGSRKTLCKVEILRKFSDLMEVNNWILELPKGADTELMAGSAAVEDDDEIEVIDMPPGQQKSRNTNASAKRKLVEDWEDEVEIVDMPTSATAPVKVKKENQQPHSSSAPSGSQSRKTMLSSWAEATPKKRPRKVTSADPNVILKGRPVLKDVFNGTD